jgi:hypothetical protein
MILTGYKWMRRPAHADQGTDALSRSTWIRGHSHCSGSSLDTTNLIQVPSPALNQDLGLAQAVDDLAVEQLVP